VTIKLLCMCTIIIVNSHNEPTLSHVCANWFFRRVKELQLLFSDHSALRIIIIIKYIILYTYLYVSQRYVIFRIIILLIL